MKFEINHRVRQERASSNVYRVSSMIDARSHVSSATHALVDLPVSVVV